jgi:glycosyltransferase involved in cell wall biosynthesis
MYVPLFITSFNRPEFVKPSLESLFNSNLPEWVKLFWTDDGSDEETTSIIKEYEAREWTCGTEFTLAEHVGMRVCKLGQIRNWFNKQKTCAEFFLVSDSDMVYAKNWVQALNHIYYKLPNMGLLSGFNTETNNHATKKEVTGLRLKLSIGGANFLMDTKLYLRRPFPIIERETHEWDYRMCELAHSEKLLVCTTNPSIVNHIGRTGVYARTDYYDTAKDFIGIEADSLKELNIGHN